MQAVSRERSLEKVCAWHTVLMVSKECGKGFQCIGLLEILWKSTTGIINWWMTAAIMYHTSLYGFQTSSVTETTILEAKLPH